MIKVVALLVGLANFGGSPVVNGYANWDLARVAEVIGTLKVVSIKELTSRVAIYDPVNFRAVVGLIFWQGWGPVSHTDNHANFTGQKGIDFGVEIERTARSGLGVVRKHDGIKRPAMADPTANTAFFGVKFCNSDLRVQLDCRGCCFSNILNSAFKPYLGISPSATDKEALLTNVNFEPWPLLRSHYFNAAARFPKGSQDQHHGSASEEKASNSSIGHYTVKPRHGLLSIQVAFGAAVVLGSFYFLLKTVPKGHSFKRDTIILYTILGILNMCLGSVLIAQAFLG